MSEPSYFLSEFQARRIEYYNDQWLVMHNEEAGFVSIPICCRGMVEYQDKQKEKFKKLRNWMAETHQPVVHLRLSPRAPAGLSPLTALIELKAQVNPFMSWLQKQLGFRPLVLWTTEPTARGYGHLHFLFIGCNFLISKEKIDNWWSERGMGTSAGVWIESLRGSAETADKVLGYCIKYITKPQYDARWAGLLTLTRKREWGMSNRIYLKIARHEANKSLSVFTSTVKTNSNWTIVGVLSEAEIRGLIHGKKASFQAVQDDLSDIRSTIKGLERSKMHGVSRDVRAKPSSYFKPPIREYSRKIFPADDT